MDAELLANHAHRTSKKRDKLFGRLLKAYSGEVPGSSSRDYALAFMPVLIRWIRDTGGMIGTKVEMFLHVYMKAYGDPLVSGRLSPRTRDMGLDGMAMGFRLFSHMDFRVMIQRLCAIGADPREIWLDGESIYKWCVSLSNGRVMVIHSTSFAVNSPQLVHLHLRACAYSLLLSEGYLQLNPKQATWTRRYFWIMSRLHWDVMERVILCSLDKRGHIAFDRLRPYIADIMQWGDTRYSNR